MFLKFETKMLKVLFNVSEIFIETKKKQKI